MFSGLIMHSGRVETIVHHPQGGALLTIEAPAAIAEGVRHGDSIAVNGVCLTVIQFDHRVMSFEVIPESLRRSVLGALNVDDHVNLELSLRMGDRLGGHLVYAHVDATIEILQRSEDGQGTIVSFALPDRYERYIVEKGYVALDGVSLTVADVEPGRFRVAMIPETAKVTSLGKKQPGEHVNLELDPMARYAVDRAALYARR